VTQPGELLASTFLAGNEPFLALARKTMSFQGSGLRRRSGTPPANTLGMLRIIIILLALLVLAPLTTQAARPAALMDDFEQLDLKALLSTRKLDYLRDFEALDLRQLLRSDRQYADFTQLDLHELLAG
jgi:hypothetical protein